jgi:hypothetical protein
MFWYFSQWYTVWKTGGEIMGGSDVDLATKQRARTMQMASSPGVQRESGQ